MSFKVSSVGLALASIVLLVVGIAASASAQTATYKLGGIQQLQIGDGLPIPIIGGIPAISGATAMQTTGPDPKQLTIDPSQFTRPYLNLTIGVNQNNIAVAQVRTNLAIQAPGAGAGGVLAPPARAGGRSGGPTVTWCPGQPGAATWPAPTSTYNPSCSNPASTSLGSPRPGRGWLIYKKTTNQFGGPGGVAIQGSADVAILTAGQPLPCDFATGPCRVRFALASPAGNAGGRFGDSNTTPGGTPSPGNFNAKVTLGGVIASVTGTGIGPGFPNPAQSWFGPVTTGMVTVKVSDTIAMGSESFMLQGSDNRVNGFGSISLVAGTIANRLVSGRNANRAWASFELSAPLVPSISNTGLALLAFGVVGGGMWLVRRRATA